jgi:hypothetical protein
MSEVRTEVRTLLIHVDQAVEVERPSNSASLLQGTCAHNIITQHVYRESSIMPWEPGICP